MTRNRSHLMLIMTLLGAISAGPALARESHGGGGGGHGGLHGFSGGGGHAPSHGYTHDRPYHFSGHYGGAGDHFVPYAYLPYGYGYPSTSPGYYGSGAYIEQAPAEADPGQSPPAFWYYCAAASAYYPYVKSCPGGWQRVLPQPPPS